MSVSPDWLWIPLTLLCAFFSASSDAATKKSLPGQDPVVLIWAIQLLTLPFFALALPWIVVPKLDAEFWKFLLAALPLEVAASVMYVQALRLSPLSLTLPFLAFTPIFLTAVSFFVLGERIHLIAGAGIFLIAAGSWVLNLKGSSGGILGPFRAMTKEKGSLLMIVCAGIYAFTSALGKGAINHSNSLFFMVVYYSLVVLTLTPIALLSIRKNGELPEFLPLAKRAILPAALTAGVLVTHTIAVSMAPVSYMISVKRTSLLIGVLYGKFLFGEKNIRSRFAGAGIMLAGFALIAIFR
jgi:drug/metabolite transporter (DMT)-like permease